MIVIVMQMMMFSFVMLKYETVRLIIGSTLKCIRAAVEGQLQCLSGGVNYAAISRAKAIYTLSIYMYI